MNVTSRSTTPFLVVDASAVVELLLAGERAQAIERVTENAQLAAPDSINPEILQAVRRLERGQAVDRDCAERMLADFMTMPIRRVPTARLLLGAWKLRANVSAYDACYVALAQRLRSQLVTADQRLARAPGLGVPLVLV